MDGQIPLDPRKLLTGKDGQLFITGSDGKQIFLAEVDTFSAQLNVSNTDYQPIGSLVNFAVNTGVTISLTFAEAVVRDDITLVQLYKDLKEGRLPQWDFQGKLKRRDGQTQRQVFRYCVPDGTIDLLNITPGDIIKRAWSFRVNSTPELLEAFGGAA